MNTRFLSTRRTVASLSLLACGLAAGGALATVGSANAATNASGTTSSSTPSTAGTGSRARSTETALTGATLESVKAAVLAKYPAATFDKVTTEDTGGYEAHITTAAGQHLTALVSTAFAVTGTEVGLGHGHGGRRSGTETDLTGATLAGVTSAVLAKYPAATFDRVTTEDGGGYEAHITNAGQHLTVVLDKAFAITSAK